jgi:hypothetical protein
MSEPRIRIALASILGVLGGSLVTPAVAKWLEVWGVHTPVDASIFLASGLFIFGLAIAVLVVPTKLLKAIWGRIAESCVCRISTWILWRQKSTDRFLHLGDREFSFLPMSGGKNLQRWTYRFEIVSCLPRHLRIDALRLEILNSDYDSINCEHYIRKNVTIKSLSKTPFPLTSVGLSNDAFEELEKAVQGKACGQAFCFNLRIQGGTVNRCVNRDQAAAT